VYNQVRKMRLL